MSKESLFQYTCAAVFAAGVIFGLYRVDVLASGEPGLSALSVATASGTLFLLGFVLLMGPLCRMFAIFDRVLKFRKELGIMTFVTSLTHVYLVMFPLARSGPWGLFRSRPFSAYPGLEALIVLFVLLIFSWNWSMKLLGTKLWWELQYWGARLAFVLIGVHMVVLKYKTIVSWAMPGNLPEAGSHIPPLIVWEAQFLLLVLVIRLSELFGVKIARIITQVSTALVLVVLLWTTFAG